MHNSLSFLTLFFMVPMLALAQTPPSQKESREDRMQALRVAYFEEELSLTPEESTLFWPAWNEKEEKLKANGKAVRAIETKLKSTESERSCRIDPRIEAIATSRPGTSAPSHRPHRCIHRIPTRGHDQASGARIQNAGDETADKRKRIRQWPTSQRSQTAWPATLLRNQANTIDTVAHARRCWSVGKQMSEVAIACSTPNFDADHAVALSSTSFRPCLAIETRPATSGIKLSRGIEQFGSAPFA